MTKLRLVVADDHPLVLAGMREMLEKDIRFEIIACVSSSTALIKAICAQAPDVVITDFSMPGDARHGDGLRLINYLSTHFPSIKILVVTMQRNPLLTSLLYKAGAHGIVFKSDPPSTLKTALECIRLGRSFTHPSITANSGNQQKHTADVALIAALSPKEIEVLRYFTEGQTPTDIAQNLKRSIKTISNQKRSAMRKLNISNDQELITFCAVHSIFN